MPIADSEKIVVPAGTTVTKTVSFETLGGKSVLLLVNLSAGAGSLVVQVNGDSAEGYSWGILTSSSLSGTGTTVLRISPDLSASANVTAKDIVPPTVQVVATVTGTLTYGIDASLGS
jgi:hypothetical protein